MSDEVLDQTTRAGKPGFTAGPWEYALGSYGKGRVHKWRVARHEFPHPPFEGELDDEWGIYPPLGEAGPVALVAGEANARLIVRH